MSFIPYRTFRYRFFGSTFMACSLAFGLAGCGPHDVPQKQLVVVKKDGPIEGDSAGAVVTKDQGSKANKDGKTDSKGDKKDPDKNIDKKAEESDLLKKSDGKTANPASALCIKLGGKSVGLSSSLSNASVGLADRALCDFNGGRIEEWTLFRVVGPGVEEKKPQEAVKTFFTHPEVDKAKLTKANPAAIYCESVGGKLDAYWTTQGADALCKFADGSSIDQWTLFRGPQDTANQALAKVLKKGPLPPCCTEESGSSDESCVRPGPSTGSGKPNVIGPCFGNNVAEPAAKNDFTVRIEPALEAGCSIQESLVVASSDDNGFQLFYTAQCSKDASGELRLYTSAVNRFETAKTDPKLVGTYAELRDLVAAKGTRVPTVAFHARAGEFLVSVEGEAGAFRVVQLDAALEISKFIWHPTLKVFAAIYESSNGARVYSPRTYSSRVYAARSPVHSKLVYLNAELKVADVNPALELKNEAFTGTLSPTDILPTATGWIAIGPIGGPKGRNDGGGDACAMISATGSVETFSRLPVPEGLNAEDLSFVRLLSADKYVQWNINHYVVSKLDAKCAQWDQGGKRGMHRAATQAIQSGNGYYSFLPLSELEPPGSGDAKTVTASAGNSVAGAAGLLMVLEAGSVWSYGLDSISKGMIPFGGGPRSLFEASGVPTGASVRVEDIGDDWAITWVSSPKSIAVAIPSVETPAK